MIVLSVLGLGRWNKETKSYEYEEAAYEWEGHGEVVRTTLVQEAFRRWYPEAEIIVLATEKAKRERAKDLQKLSRLTVVDIPDGKSEGEFWQIYNAITEALPKDSEVILDITHGLRSLPHLAFSALIFLKAAKHIQIRAVVYAANEARSPSTDHTPILDLTPFVTMLDWASATNRFLETGDARRFNELLSGSGEQSLRDLGSDLRKFTSALLLNRTLEASEFAAKLVKDLDLAKLSSQAQYQPLRLLEDSLAKAVTPIADDRPIASQFAQIVWYTKQQQHAQAIALAREWLISVRIWKSEGRFSVNKHERQLAEEWLATFAKILEHPTDAEKEAEKQGDKARQDKEKQKRYKSIPEGWLEFIKLWQRVSNQRNDYAHFGMRTQSATAENTLKNAKDLPEDLKGVARSIGLELPQESP